MGHNVINNEIRVSLPQDFITIDRDKIEKSFRLARRFWGMQNSSQDMIVYAGWTGRMLLPDFLSGTPRVLDLAVARTKKNMTDFTCEKMVKFKICGAPAEGVRFECSNKNSEERIHGEITAVKLKKRYYYFAYSSSNEDSLYCRQVFHGMLASLSAL